MEMKNQFTENLICERQLKYPPKVEIPLHVPGCIADMPEAEGLKRSKAKRCWICGNKLRSGRNYPRTIDGYERDLHKFCAEQHDKTEARSDNAFGLEY